MTEFIKDALAAHRLVRLVHSDAIFDEPRMALTGWLLKNGWTKTRYLLQCQYCLGVHAAALVLLLRKTPLRDILAMAGASALLFDLLEGSPSEG